MWVIGVICTHQLSYRSGGTIRPNCRCIAGAPQLCPHFQSSGASTAGRPQGLDSAGHVTWGEDCCVLWPVLVGLDFDDDWPLDLFFFGFRSLFSDCESHQPTHLPSWIMNRSRLIGWTLSENPYSTHYSIRLLVGSLVGYNPLKYRVDFDSDPIKNPWIVKSQNSPTPAKLPWNS